MPTDEMTGTPKEPLISIIMPAYNAEPYIRAAIDSVIAQSWTNWELLIINDGSTDGTASVLAEYKGHERIRISEQANRGVSNARNAGLRSAQGAFVAFLDADDILPKRGLEARARLLMRDPQCTFADGRVVQMDHATGRTHVIHAPTYRGETFHLLMGLSAEVFCGQTWMIRRSVIGDARFPEHMSHAEDMAFYLTIARRGIYCSTPEEILCYRKGHGSAMTDIDGLDRGYLALYRHARSLLPPADERDLTRLWRRIRRVMTLGYLKWGMPGKAFRALMRKRPA